MTETHKAAVEALDTMPSNRIYGGIKSATQFKKELGEWAFNNLDALRTLKQPSSVEVTEWQSMDTAPRDGTPILALEKYSDSPAIVKFRNNRWAQYSDGMPVEDLDAKILCLNEEGMIWKPIRMPVDDLRITRAAATDGVKS